ncbi:MAG: helix-turn-helix transcriptional regulator [Cytophagales bacterium]|jgi:transcriptional regulator with XRE-family HTH domain|nr:helix-turn-helix transcriptional regulator [Cytophagales bacterium]MCA6430945.1 helix-turn-helix transcriptional regulator [Cytophagales bacterium]MCE2957459.1 helix-turn-helix domain-containing protein [Flammeovirgaceae bacterium]
MNFFLKRFGDRIRVLRLLKNYTQENVAEELGISGSAYAKIERGESDISISRIEQIGKVYGLNASQLISMTDSIQKTDIPKSDVDLVSLQISQEFKDTIVSPTLIFEQIQAMNSKIDLLQKRIDTIEKRKY